MNKSLPIEDPLKLVLNSHAADSATATISANDGAESPTTFTGGRDGKMLRHTRLVQVRIRQFNLFGHSFLNASTSLGSIGTSICSCGPMDGLTLKASPGARQTVTSAMTSNVLFVSKTFGLWFRLVRLVFIWV